MQKSPGPTSRTALRSSDAVFAFGLEVDAAANAFFVMASWGNKLGKRGCWERGHLDRPGEWKKETTRVDLSPALAELYEPERLPELGPGSPNRAAYAKLKDLRVPQSFAPHAVRDASFAEGCLAGLWLLHDYLEESHRISQRIHTPTGSYWHGIMHRREPDYSNSAYWFRRVGDHPIFPELRREAAEIARGNPAAPNARFLTEQSEWDPFAFIDLCRQAAAAAGELNLLCRRIQRKEWDLLFDYCYRQATGT